MLFSSLLHPKPSHRQTHPVVLLVLDGWGVAPVSSGNAVALAKTPNIQRLLAEFPNSQLIASGESVGLPANEVGNTEVGHLTMGAGRIILQDLKRINVSIFNRSFFQNPAFLQAAQNTKARQSKLHLIGLVGSGNVHSSLEHLMALLQFCKLTGVNKLYLHLFTDGRDSPQREAIDIVGQIEQKLKDLQLGRIATIAGRDYGMDRDGRWDRTEKAYKAIAEGEGIHAVNSSEAILSAYHKNLTDEFIEPTVIDPTGTVESGDSIIFYNFRIDRPRQLTMPFLLPNFESLKSFEFEEGADSSSAISKVHFDKTFTRTKKLENLYFVTMTEYQKAFPVSAIAFPPEKVKSPLGEILSQHNLVQVHMSESEKERFVTYYFNGLRNEAFAGEERIIVPSPKVPTYDKRPQMSIERLTEQFRYELYRDRASFFVVNFANPDMVAHTGNIQATIKALEYTDKAIGIFANEVLDANGTLLITADHGNAEELLTYPSNTFFFTTSKGTVNTDHSNNPVPFILVSQASMGNKSIKILNGTLADIAPTILDIMNIDQPPQMTGKSLLQSNS
jgi:2,3-bisphosphoglycerate-independent phosphoglycerate mutase